MPAANQQVINFSQLTKALQATHSKKSLPKAIVNEPFHQPLAAAYLFLGFIVLYIVAEDGDTVQLSGVSDTEYYEMSVSGYKFSPSQFKLSLAKDTDNTIVEAISTGQPQETTDWRTLRRSWADPVKTNLNQANSGISRTIIYPLDIPHGGALMFCYYQYDNLLSEGQRDFMKRYCQITSEVLKNL
ncbi:MAG TPA: hypothetical protein VG604_02200 [Candidatus Saccharimonadales bacterium]|nr:hypothetical protein [Candidatus Saccharimonadales bacterium]